MNDRERRVTVRACLGVECSRAESFASGENFNERDSPPRVVFVGPRKPRVADVAGESPSTIDNRGNSIRTVYISGKKKIRHGRIVSGHRVYVHVLRVSTWENIYVNVRLRVSVFKKEGAVNRGWRNPPL